MDPAECPKCGAARERALAGQACPSCGLKLERWADFTLAPPSPHELLDPAFVALADRWDDPKAHEQFIALARSLGALDVAAVRYRQRRDEEARRALGQIALLAAQETTHAPRDRPRLGPFFAAIWIFSIAAMVAIAFAVWKVATARP